MSEERDAVRTAIGILETALAQLRPSDREYTPWLGDDIDYELSHLRWLLAGELDADIDDHYVLQGFMFRLKDLAAVYRINAGPRYGLSPANWRLSFACECAAKAFEPVIGEYWLEP